MEDREGIDEEAKELDLMGFLGGTTFELEFDYDLNDVDQIMETLDFIRAQITCEFCDNLAVYIDESMGNAVRCEFHQDDSEDSKLNNVEKIDDKLDKFKEEVELVKESMLEAQIMFGTVIEEGNKNTIDEKEIEDFRGEYQRLVS